MLNQQVYYQVNTNFGDGTLQLFWASYHVHVFYKRCNSLLKYGQSVVVAIDISRFSFHMTMMNQMSPQPCISSCHHLIGEEALLSSEDRAT